MSSIYSSEYQLDIKNRREIRKKKGINRERLAQALKRPQSFVAKVESGERRIGVVEFAYIAGLLGIEQAPLLQKILVKVAPL